MNIHISKFRTIYNARLSEYYAHIPMSPMQREPSPLPHSFVCCAGPLNDASMSTAAIINSFGDTRGSPAAVAAPNSARDGQAAADSPGRPGRGGAHG